MTYRLHTGLWLLALGLPFVGCHQASEPDEGAYQAPPGFEPQAASRVARSPGSFARLGDRVVTATLLARASSRASAGQAEDASSDDPDQATSLEASFAADYAGGVRVSVSSRPSAWVEALPEGATSAAGKLRSDGAVLSFEGAYAGVTAAYGASRSRVEEFLSVAHPEDAPKLRYRLRRGPDFGRWDAGDDGKLWGFDAEGRSLFVLEAPVATGADGAVRKGRWKLDPGQGEDVVTADLDVASMVFPVVIDPTFESPRWFDGSSGEPAARLGAAATYAPGPACVVLFGGVGSGAAPLADTRVRCGGLWQGNDIAGATRPSARGYAALAQGPNLAGAAAYYLFGGTVTKPLDDLWVLTLGGSAGARTGTWAQVAYPASKTTSNWPAARMMHGMSLDASGNLILWGGVDAVGNLLGDTWQYSPSTGTWTQLCASCFQPRYGFAPVQKITGSTAIYAVGGWDGAAMTSTVQSWSGSGWNQVAVNDALLPLDEQGNVLSSATAGTVSPLPRYVGFGVRTPGGNTLYGGGVVTDAAGNDTYQQDLWLWNEPAGESRWVREGATAASALPGARETPVAVYDEGRKESVIFGGGSSATSGSVVGQTRLLRSDSDAVTLTVAKSGGGFTLSTDVNIQGPDKNANVYFMRRSASTSVWSEITGCGTAASPVFPNNQGVLSCSVSAAEAAGVDAFAVRTRNKNDFGSGCTAAGQLCNPSVAYSGLASCGVPQNGGAQCPAVP